MILPPRTLAIRLFFWTALLVYAIWNLRGKRSDDVFVPEPAPVVDLRVPLPRPAAPAPQTAPEGAAPPIVDIDAAVAAMDAAASGLVACAVTGTFSVRLGADGLAEAWILAEPALSEAATTCAAGAAWGAPWPRTAQTFEMERAVTGSSNAAPPAGTVK